jgi:hypothetical protein
MLPWEKMPKLEFLFWSWQIGFNWSLKKWLVLWFSVYDVKISTVKIPTVKIPTVKIPTVKIPTIIIPTVKIPNIKIHTVKIPYKYPSLRIHTKLSLNKTGPDYARD